MKTNRLLPLALALFCLAAGYRAGASNIVWVSNNPNTTGFSPATAGTGDDGFVTLLQAQGHNVIRFSSDDSQNVLLTQEFIDALNTNDLIIVGRSVSSGAFQAPQGRQWNTNITKPILNQNAYLARNSRFGYFSGSDDIPDVRPMPLTVVNPLDPTNAYLFGSAAMAGSVTAGDYDVAMGRWTSHINPTNPPVAGGRVLATGLDTNGAVVNVIVEYAAGTVVKGGSDISAGYRLYFAGGSRELNGSPVSTAGSNNLSSAVGEAIFLRAVNLALNNGVPPNLGQAPAITTQPANISGCAGGSYSLSVTATGQDPLFYQWFQGVDPVSDGTNATLSIPNLQAANEGIYTVVVSNLISTATSDPATVAITGIATTAIGPDSQTNCPGTPAIFTTVASGSGTLSYTWLKDATIVQGPDGNNTYSIASVTPADAGAYAVVVMGDCGTVTNNFTLAVTAAPVIATQPQSQSTPMGNGAVFTVAATAEGVITYQWKTNGVDVIGATGASFAISNLTLLDSGMSVQCITTTCAGSTPSTVATLTVTPIAGVTFNFDTPGQFTNAPYSMVYNDWLNSSFNTPNTVFESAVGGTGPFPGSGALDLLPSTGTGASTVNSAILLPLSYDFSLPGKTLSASVMVKIKTPFRNAADRNTQIGFCTSTNTDLNNNAGFSYMTVILNKQTTATTPTFSLRQGHKLNGASTFAEGNAAADGLLTVSNWYKITAKFQNMGGGTFSVEASLVDMGPNGTTPGATVQTVGPVTLNNADVTSARNLYFVLRGIENTGVENWDNVWVSTATGDITFVQQPQTQTVLQGRRATFRALVDGDGPYVYQWKKDGVDIPGATSWKYITPPLTSADAGNYSVSVTGSGGFPVDSADAVLTVNADPLTVVGAGSVDGTTVGVEFNQPVDPVTAANPANYLIDGTAAVQARIYKTGLGPMGLDGIYVILTPASVLSGSFTLAVNNVKDLSGNTIGANSTAGYFAGLTGVDINPLVTAPQGENYCFGLGNFIIMGGGADIWNLADQTRYVYTQKTGDFDVKIKVPYLDVVRSPSKAGFHVRNSLDAFDKVASALLNPMWPGRDYPEGSTRQTNNTPSTSWGSTPNYSLAWYPDAWLRFRRAGNVFLRYSSTDGVNWNFDGQTSSGAAAWQWMVPDSLYFGLAVCSVANNNPCSARIENYGDFAGYPGAAIAISSQPTNFTVAAGSTYTDGLIAAVAGGGIPASAGELVYLWQRDNGSGVFTNLVTAGATNNTVTLGPLFSSDNGAQFRCVLRAPGAADVISSTFTATVTDTTAPTIASVNATLQESYPVMEVVVNFSEPVAAASALDTGNYTVTNAAGSVLTIVSAEFLSGDPRAVLLKLGGALGTGTSSVTVTAVRDLNSNIITPATSTFRSFAQATGPVVVEVYQDMGNSGATLNDLVNTNIFTAGTPTYITYSNLFGYNVALSSSTLAGLGYTLGTVAQDNYGVRAYTYFVPPSTGNYKFWIRSDDSMQLWMNTNGPLVRMLRPSSQNCPIGQAVQYCVDGNTSTKYLNFDKLNTGFTITPANGPKTVVALRFTTGGDAPERDPMTYRLEGTSGDPITGPWTLIASGSTGLDTDPGRGVTVPDVTFANVTAYLNYRLTFPTVRNAASANSMQIAEVGFIDDGSVNVALDIGKVLIAANTAFSGNYTVGSTPASSITNISLVGGQPYYLEMIGKEGTGGDGFSVMWTDPTVNTAPANTAFISTANLAYPSLAARPTPVVVELFTGYQNFLAGYNTLSGLYAATNRPTSSAYTDKENWKYLSGVADFVGYQPYFGMQPTFLYNTRYDNYLGRAYAYFIAPSNGLYKFYVAVDDVAVLFMNTNATDSTDPMGKVLLGTTANAYVSTASQLVAQNVPLVGGQKYYTEVLWREGGGGDGFRLAVRSQGDAALPPTTEWIQASMLEYPAGLCRAGAVNYDYIAPVNPTVADGQSLILNAVGIRGSRPYGGFVWYKNGQQVMANSFTNITPPLTMSDNGSIYTLVITNNFSRVERSVTVTVLPDSTAPTIVQTVGRRYNDGFTLVFSEPVDAASATYLGNYQISGGLQLLGATLDQTRTMVSFTTSPQALDTTYTVTVNGVKDASSAGNMIAANTMTSFTAWSVGGNGFLVEIWTNIPNGGIVDLTGQPKFQANLPDVTYYTNVFGVGAYGANTGLENYGARVTGYFVPTNTAFYRFYSRSDDASEIWMNINSTDSENPAGRTMLVHMPSANQSMGTALAQSQPVYLNSGQRYYIEGLMKEGTGGDYLLVAFRECDASGTALAGTPADAATSIASAGSFGGAPGNPDLVQITQTPPTELFLTELDPVNLVLAVNLPASYRLAASYQWQKSTDGGATFGDVAGGTGTNLAFVASLADDNAQYRVVFTAPGRSAIYTTLLHVAVDTTPPYILSVGSLDGYTVAVQWNEIMVTNEAADVFNTAIYDGNNNQMSLVGDYGTPLPDNRTVLFYLDRTQPPITTPTFRVETVNNVHNQAATPLEAVNVSKEGVLMYLTPQDIGTAGDPAVVGQSYSVTNTSVSIKAGGSDVWGTADHMQMAYRAVTGNFDVKVRVESDRGPGAWSKAGLMVRGSTNANSRNIFLAVTPTLDNVPTGANRYQFAWRDIDGGSTTWASEAAIVPEYPNAWLRLQRVGSVINAYWGNNGVDWTLYASRDTANFGGGAYADTMLVGLFLDAGNNTDPNGAQAEFRDLSFPLPPSITIQPGPTPVTIGIHQNVTFSGMVVSGTGPFNYQWRKNGNNLSGATADSLSITDTKVADSGNYSVFVANDGGAVVSADCVLIVTNDLPVVAGETAASVGGGAVNISVGDLLVNDTDPEGDPLSVTGVSGVYPVTVATNFDEGTLADSTLYNNGVAGSGTWDATVGVDGSGGIALTPGGVGSAQGSFVINELTPGKRVSAFTASFKLRVSDPSAEPADGMSFNFGPDLPNSAGTGAAAEQGGTATGLSFCIDNYRFQPIAVGSAYNAPGGGTANTSGMKVNYKGIIIAGVQIPTWVANRYVPVSISVSADGVLTVLVDGTNVFGNLVLPNYTPMTGRFGFYARTGGQYMSQRIDDLAITVLTADTAYDCALNGTRYGTARTADGYLHLTDAVVGQAGSFIVNELTPGVNVKSFTADFKLRIGSGSGNAADGFSLNFASDLPDAATGATGAEEGLGTGLSVSVDNYPTAGADSPSIKIKWGGNLVVPAILIPKWNNPNFIPVSINLHDGGALDVTVDGTNVVTGLASGYTPIAGRFGFFARTGGEYETHWVDDVAINVVDANDSTAQFVTDFTGCGPGSVGLTNDVVTYVPPAGACGGSDTFYYLVSDGQVGGVSVDSVQVNLSCAGPALSVGLTGPGGDLVISWADTGSGTLYQTTDLTAPIAWTSVSVTPTLNNGVWTAVIPAPTVPTFYALRNP